ncbi:MAG TPA: alanine racemase [bacterium]|nr:alanine racemase [bacterium]
MTSTRSTRAIVDLASLERNWRLLSAAHAKGRIMTVLKANAYGHGMVPVARFLQGLGQPLFGVALLDEALALRHAGITGRILVLGPPEPGSLPLYAREGIEATVPSLAHLREAIAAAAEGALAVHLKCDTGMGRIGLREDARDELRALLHEANALQVRGVYSHLADSEQLDSDFCETQLERYEAWCAAIAEALPGRPFERHLANSGGLLRDARFHFDYARVGFALWAPLAFSPPEQAPALTARLEQPLTVRTRVSLVKTMRTGETVGYGRTYRCSADEVIATLPVGYGDGYFRNLGNRGAVVLAGKRRPIVGRVSMDQTTVSLGQDSCQPGDEAILLGGGPEGIAAAELGAWASTIDYEVFTNVAARVPREYVYDSQPIPEP